MVPKARFGRIPRNGKSSFTIMTLHCHSAVAKKRSIPLTVLLAVRTAIIQEDIDHVAGDFNCGRKTGPEKTPGSLCPFPHRCCVPSEWTDVCLSSLQTPIQNGSYASMARPRLIMKTCSSPHNIKQVTTKRGSTRAV